METKRPIQSLCSQLDEQLLKDQYEEASKPSTYFPLRPSSAGKCTRYLAHETSAFLGKEEGIAEIKKPSIVRLLNLGHSIEENALGFLSRIPGYSVRYKQQVVSIFKTTNGRLIDGSIDTVMWSDNTAEKPHLLLDVKSVGNGWDVAFSSRWEKDKARLLSLQSVEAFPGGDGIFIKDLATFIREVGEHTLVSNLLQCNLYLGSSFAIERGITTGSIYRYEKNSSQHFEVRFDFSPIIFKTVCFKFDTAEQAALSGRPQEAYKDFVLGSMACAYCPRQQACWPDATKAEVFAGAPKKRWAKRLTDFSDDVQVNTMNAVLAYDSARKRESESRFFEEKLISAIEATGEDRLKMTDGRVFRLQKLKSPPKMVIREDKE